MQILAAYADGVLPCLARLLIGWECSAVLPGSSCFVSSVATNRVVEAGQGDPSFAMYAYGVPARDVRAPLA